jgi:hypothetical protein
MSLHASDENYENLTFFVFLIFSQGVSLGFVTSNIHVTKSSFSSFDFLDGFGMDGLSGFPHGIEHNHFLKLSR